MTLMIGIVPACGGHGGEERPLPSDGATSDTVDAAAGALDAAGSVPDAAPSVVPTALWETHIGDYEHENPRLAFTTDGDIILAGRFYSELVMDGVIVATAMSEAGVVARFDGASGALEWIRVLDAAKTESWRELTIAPDGAIWVMGWANELNAGAYPLTFGGTTVIVPSGGCGLVAKYAPNGDVLAFSMITSTASIDTHFGTITVGDNGEVFIAGSFWDDATVAGVTLAPPQAPQWHNYVARLNPATAQAIWAQALVAGDAVAYPADLATDGSRVFLAGSFAGTLTVGPLPRLTTTGNHDLYLAAFDTTDGTPTWARAAGTTSLDQWRRVRVIGGELVTVGLAGLSSATTLTYGESTAVLPAGEAAFIARTSLATGVPLGVATLTEVSGYWYALEAAVTTSGNVLLGDGIEMILVTPRGDELWRLDPADLSVRTWQGAVAVAADGSLAITVFDSTKKFIDPWPTNLMRLTAP